MKTWLFLFLASLLALPLQAQTTMDLLDPHVRDLLNSTLDGDRSKEYVTEIAKHHRVQASPGYREAAAYVLQELRSFGFSERDAFIESFPSDGKIVYQTWPSPPGWEITSGELRMVEPAEGSITSFPETPLSVMSYSNPGDVTAELIWVGAGTSDDDYKGKDVKGKFVLATGYGGEVHRLAVLKYKAKAVVCYMDDARSKDHLDMVGYTGIWPRPEELDKVTFGFNLSRNQGERLKGLLEEGKKVVLHGSVTGKGNHSFFMDVVVAQIHGTQKPEAELVLSAHLDHPKECANDNASGSAALLDIARALRSLLDSGKLPAPRLSLRFLWVPEWNGTMAYVDAHPELRGPALGGRCLANINLDMVGENLELLHSKLYIVGTPSSTPSILDDVVENMAWMTDNLNFRPPHGSQSQMNFRTAPYGGGSDHMMFLDRKIPSVMLGHSDWTHHTSEDTPDKVDPTELQRSEMIAAGTMWFLASIDVPHALDFLELFRSKAGERMADIGRHIRPMISAVGPREIPGKWAEVDNMTVQAMEVESNAALTLNQFINDPRVKLLAENMRPHIGKRFEYLFALSRETVEANGYSSDLPADLDATPDTRIPVRLTRGPLEFRLPESTLPPKEAQWYQSKDFPLNGNMRFEAVNLIDGKRTVEDIRAVLLAEFTNVPLSAVSRFLNDLVTAGAIKWK